MHSALELKTKHNPTQKRSYNFLWPRLKYSHKKPKGTELLNQAMMSGLANVTYVCFVHITVCFVHTT